MYSKTLSLLSLLLFLSVSLSAQLTVSIGTDVAICEGEIAQLNSEVSGGDGNYTYAWTPNTGLSDATIANPTTQPSSTTTYSLLVTDGTGLDGTDEVTITVWPAPVVSISTTDATCGFTNGSAVAIASGGSAPYTFVWANGATTSAITDLSSGVYGLTVTDANGCTNTADATIEDIMNLVVDAGPGATICDGSSTTITANAASGTPPYIYEWTNGATTASITVSPLVTTTYGLTLTDANGCDGTDQVTVNVSDNFMLDLSATAVACGNSDGTATATPSGGQTPYVYSWSNDAATATATDLTPGLYFVTVNDALGCAQTGSITVGDAVPVIASATVTDADCNGTTTGTISVNVAGGTPDYTYAWVGPDGFTADAATITNLPAGTYTLEATDASGCTAEESFEVEEPSILTITGSVASSTCSGDENASISVSVSGGTPGYAYSWLGTNGFAATTADITNLSPGVYDVTVTDANGCTAEESFQVTAPISLSIDFDNSIVSDATCGQGDGAIDLVIAGGTAPFAYAWSTGEATQDIANLWAGSYEVEVTDGNGCQLTGVFIIVDVTDLTVDLGPAQTFCPGESVMLTAEVENGTPGYTYLWSNGEIGNPITLSVLNTTTIFVTVTDANQCSATDQVTLISGLNATGIANNVSCVGSNDGSIQLQVNGGTESYTYNWSDIGDTGSQGDRTDLATGTYTVTITDGVCSTNLSFVVEEEEFVPLDLIVDNPFCFGSANGNIFINNHPIAGYSYLWSTGNTTANLTGLSAGTYCVTVTNSSGCEEEACAIVEDPIQLNVIVEGLPTEPCAEDYTLTATITGGSAPYVYVWSIDGAVFSTTASITGTFEGSVQVTVTDANGCSVTVMNFIETQPEANAATLAYLSCTDGLATLDGTGSTGGPDITYEWIGPDGFVSNDLVAQTPLAGEYRLLVAYTGGDLCEDTTSVTVVDLAENFESGIDVALLGCNDYRLSGITPFGYVGEVAFAWTFPDGNNSSEETITPNATGVYTLTTTAVEQGCEHHSTVFVDLDATDCITINGFVRTEADENCLLNPSAPTLSDVQIIASGPSGDFSTFTDEDGYYEMNVPLDVVTIEVIEPSASWEACFASTTLGTANPGDVIPISFWLKPLLDCPELSINLSASFLRRCFTSLYCLRICNEGTEVATNPIATLVMDPFLSFSHASISPTSQDGQFLNWDLAPLAPGTCRIIYVWVDVSCDAELGQTHCSEAFASPSPLCAPSDNWSGTNLELTGNCDGGEVQFTVRNTGTNDLDETVQYIVIEDAVAMMNSVDLDNLGGDQEETFSFPANGSTYTFQIEQVENHPYSSNLSVSIEGCGTNDMGNFSTGFVTQYSQVTATDATDIFCLENVGSYDPNDKAALPVGYGEQHYIVPETELYYRIRFQNTGTDTAFTVVIRDTLSDLLDIRTLSPGNSTHDYELALTNERALTFTFNNILLPDSTTNLEASQGFVDFRIYPLEDAPLEEVIENSAAIYFDFNEPIITNTVFHTLGRNFLEVVNVTLVPELNINWEVYPNPVSDQLQLSVSGDLPSKLRLDVYDTQGRQLKTHVFSDPTTQLQLADLASGTYLIRLVDAEQGQLLGTATVMKK